MSPDHRILEATDSKLSVGELLLLAGWFVGFLVLLTTIPYRVAIPDDVESAASLLGYNNGTAYQVTVLWSTLGIGVVAWWTRRTRWEGRGAADHPNPLCIRRLTWRDYLVLLSIATFAVTMSFPVFLAKRGPFVEDSLMLAILQRRQGGQIPFVDFKFLYGPLMMSTMDGWTALFGYSKVSYYSCVALFVAVEYTLLMAILQRYVASPWRAAILFCVIAAILFETLVGINWNGTRRLIPLVALIAIAESPYRRRSQLICTVICGVMLAYSHDFGVAAMIGVLAIYSLEWWKLRNRASLVAVTLIFGGSALIWFVVTLALMQGGFMEYIRDVLYLTERYSRGEAGFRFYWTANAVAVFLVFWLACAAFGRGLGVPRSKWQIGEGDRLMAGGLAFAIVIFKTGLTRCDLWHLNPTILGVTFAFLLPLPRRIFSLPKPMEQCAQTAIVIASLTYLYGNLPLTKYYLGGYLNGIRDTLAGRPADASARFETAAPCLLWESGDPRPDRLALAEYFANEERFGKPVFFYMNTYGLSPEIGVYNTDDQIDQLVYSDEAALRLRDFLEHRPDAYILMRQPEYERLFGIRDVNDFRENSWWLTKTTMPSLLATVHYEGMYYEQVALERRMRRTVGVYVMQHFDEAARFGHFVVLHGNASSPGSPEQSRPASE